jgi:hypothetical protein
MQREAADYAQRFDGMVDKDLPAELKPLLGTGGVQSLPDAQRAARVQLNTAFVTLKEGFAQAGAKLTDQQILQEAARVVFKTEMDRAAQAKQNASVHNRLRTNGNGRFVAAPPGNTSTSNLSQEAQALEETFARISARTGVPIR